MRSLTVGGRRNPRADRPERRRQDDAVQPRLRLSRPPAARAPLWRTDRRLCRREHLQERGIARSFQITNLFGKLSIYENLRLSLPYPPSRPLQRLARHRQPRAGDAGRPRSSLSRPRGNRGDRRRRASYGGQRLVDLGIALGAQPQVLLLDEPLAGLAAAERERVSNLVKNVAANIPVLIVEHDIDRVLGFSHRVTVMNQGEVLMAGSPAEVRADKRVQEIYTGSGTPPVTGRAARHARGQHMCCASSG